MVINSRGQFTIRSMLIVTCLIAFIMASYCRGDYLLGKGAGVMYAVVASLISLLLLRNLWKSPLPGRRLLVLCLFVIPVSTVFAFPTYFNPDLQIAVDAEKIERKLRMELGALFANDPAFEELEVAIEYRRGFSVEVSGAVANYAVLYRLQAAVFHQCEFLGYFVVNWRIDIRDKSTTYTGTTDNF